MSLVIAHGRFRLGSHRIEVCSIGGHRDLWLRDMSDPRFAVIIGTIRRGRGEPMLQPITAWAWPDQARKACLDAAMAVIRQATARR